jgi:hypothetical protein
VGALSLGRGNTTARLMRPVTVAGAGLALACLIARPAMAPAPGSLRPGSPGRTRS